MSGQSSTLKSEPIHIVLIEDDKMAIFLVQTEVLAHLKAVKLTLFTSGEAAIPFIHGITAESPDPPRLFLLDIDLPKYSGLDLITIIRRNPHCGGIPIVVLAASDSPFDRERMLQAGADHYFVKETAAASYITIGRTLEYLLFHQRKPDHQ
jgi:CheY-like chemotaxis protein